MKTMLHISVALLGVFGAVCMGMMDEDMSRELANGGTGISKASLSRYATT